MTLRDVQLADMAAIIGYDGHRFQWNGGDYPCMIGDLTTQKPLEDGGFIQEFDATITARTVDLPSLPQVGERVTTTTGITGGTYRIMRVRENHYGTLVALDLMTVNK